MRTTLYFYLFFGLSILKVFLVLMIRIGYVGDSFGGGNDADYYDAYAEGEGDMAPNVWPQILRYLNDLNLYSRTDVSYVLMVLGILIIPLLIGKAATISEGKMSGKIYWLPVLAIAAYPTLFYFSLDIYRDVFMVFCFAVVLVVARKFGDGISALKKVYLAGIFFTFAYLLYLLRPYLGVAVVAAVFCSRAYSFSRLPFWKSFIFFSVAINILYIFNLFEPLLKYRSLFLEDTVGGNNLGIVYNSTIAFLPSFWMSYYYQMMGGFFSGIPSVFAFVTESVPFICMTVYLVWNRKYSNKFVDYLVVFFILYSTVWLLGNDNLGTAVRLRMFSYIAILIATVVVYQRKRIYKSDLQSNPKSH